MAWYSYLMGISIPLDLLDASIQPVEIVQAIKDPQHYVYANSRRGVLLGVLAEICKISTTGQQLYLLQDVCLDQGHQILRCIEQLEALIEEITVNPRLVHTLHAGIPPARSSGHLF